MIDRRCRFLSSSIGCLQLDRRQPTSLSIISTLFGINKTLDQSQRTFAGKTLRPKRSCSASKKNSSVCSPMSKGGSQSAGRACRTGRKSISCPSKDGSTTSTDIRMPQNFLKDAFATTGLRIKRSFFLRDAPGAIRRAFIALPQALPRRFAHRPSRVTSLAKSSFACRNGQSTSRRPRCGMTTPFSSGSGCIFRTQTSRWKSRR